MEGQVVLNDDGRISSMSYDTILTDATLTIDFPDDFDPSTLHHYKVVNGELVYDPLPEPEPVPSELDKAKAEIAALKAENLMVMGALTDVYEMMLGGLSNG